MSGDLLEVLEPATMERPIPLTEGIKVPAGIQASNTYFAVANRFGHWHAIWPYEWQARRDRASRGDGNECQIVKVRVMAAEVLPEPVVAKKTRKKKS